MCNALLVVSGIAGAQTLVGTGSTLGVGFQRDLAFVGDIDGDGYEDFATGQTVTNAPGRVEVRSGRTTQVIWQASPGTTADDFGRSIAAYPDFDGDGVDDLLVGAPGTASNTGQVYVISGLTGAVLFTVPGTVFNGRFGWQVLVDDLDQDGIPDALVSAPGRVANVAIGTPAIPGRVEVIQTGTLAYMTTLIEPAGGVSGNFPSYMAVVGDVNGDGLREVGATRPFNNQVEVMSPGGFSIATLPAAAIFGTGVTVGGGRDLDNDGVPDIAVQQFGTLTTWSGASIGGVPAIIYATPVLNSPFTNCEVELVDDLDYDGVDDLALNLCIGLGAPRLLIASGADGSPIFSGGGLVSGGGAALATGRDIDGDGTDDVVVAAGSGYEVWTLNTLPPPTDTNLGLGCGGANEPTLTVSPALIANQPVPVTIGNLAPGAMGEVWVTASAASTPLGGGCIASVDLADPNAIVLPFVEAGAGTATVQVPVGLDLALVGVGVVVQAGVDVGGGLALSEARAVSLGF